MREALIVEYRGQRFRFYYDRDVRELLHIVLRHGTRPEDAMQTFFDAETHEWNQARERFEAFTDSHGLYWTRHPLDQSVIVITCFSREDG